MYDEESQQAYRQQQERQSEFREQRRQYESEVRDRAREVADQQRSDKARESRREAAQMRGEQRGQDERSARERSRRESERERNQRPHYVSERGTGSASSASPVTGNLSRRPSGGHPILFAVLIGGAFVAGLMARPTLSQWADISVAQTRPREYRYDLGSASGTIAAPGKGRQRYVLFTVDTSKFAEGGTLHIDIQLGQGESDASFDLFQSGAPIPTWGVPQALASVWNVPRGGTASIGHRFSKGDRFQFGATGNWDSRMGATNTFSFTAWVD